MNEKPYCITFAGPFGCSKSPVAQYLSCELGVPIIANDVVRNEIKEDTLSGEPNQQELEKRVGARMRGLVARKQSFIHDASQDRRWKHFIQSNFDEAGYKVGVISFDLSPAFYRQLIKAKRYDLTDADMARYLSDHEQFKAAHSDRIMCSVTDETFSQRLDQSLAAVRRFIG